MYSAAEENYLKALLSLANEQHEVSVNELSKRLEIKMPTVNSMMKKFAEKGLVHFESYKPIRLTAEGKRLAALIVRKHRLTEMFLYEKMGFGWEEVHEIAEQMEHIQAPKLFEKMDEILGFPKFDPHGSPIPDAHGLLETPDYTPLSGFNAGDSVKLMAISDSSESFLRFLNQKHLQLGTLIHIKSKETYDGSIRICIGDGPVEMLSRHVTERLMVLPV